MPNKNTTLFISDLHLSEKDPKTTEHFFYFMEHIAPESDALYILGDFFDAYIGDDDKNPFIASIQKSLSKAAEKGLSIFLMRGNRDFMLGNKFALISGVTLVSDPCVITLHDKKIILTHGDRLCTTDRNYQYFRCIVQHWLSKKLFLSLPFSFRQKIADSLRKESTKHNYYKSAEKMDVSNIAVSSILKKYHADTLIHGHTHKPAIHDLGNDKKRIVLSAWHEGGQYLEMSENGVSVLISL